MKTVFAFLAGLELLASSLQDKPPGKGGKRAMDNEIKAEIRAAVRGGFDAEDRVVAQFLEERYEPGELDPRDVKEAVAREFAALREEQKSWPKETDCDRLTQVFKSLNAKGVVAIENAGYTQSDGYDDTREAYEKLKDKSKVAGYCFYHGQDLERAVAGAGLYLAFGPIDPAKEETDGVRVGKLVVEELKAKGFAVQWKGTFGDRILIQKLDWKRRIRP